MSGAMSFDDITRFFGINVIPMKINFKDDIYILKWKTVLLGLFFFFFCRWLFIETLNNHQFVLTLLFYAILLILSGLITGFFSGDFAEFNTIVVGLIIGVIFLVMRIALSPKLVFTRMLFILVVIPVSSIALTYIGGIIQKRLKANV